MQRSSLYICLSLKALPHPPKRKMRRIQLLKIMNLGRVPVLVCNVPAYIYLPVVKSPPLPQRRRKMRRIQLLKIMNLGRVPVLVCNVPAYIPLNSVWLSVNAPPPPPPVVKRPPPALTQNLPSLISLMDSVDVKHHVYFTNTEISRLKW